MRVMILALVAALSMTTGAAAAKQPLSEVKSINDGLLALGLADEIRNECDDIDARMIRAWAFINDLVNEAEALGYTRAEIETFRKSKAEKARLRKLGEAYLAENGVNRDRPETLCHLGRVEIARGSQIGLLIKAR